jgi:dihydrofolate reductase
MTGRVIASASTSLDGFVALPDDTIGPLFDWYEAGDVAVPNAGDLPDFHLTRASADHWRAWTASVGALVVGRRLFDLTDGWRGQHPIGVPVVVLTHEPPTDWAYAEGAAFTFVTTGVEDAVATAKRLAGSKDVGVAAGTIAGQVLAAGLLDAAAIDLVPVVLGAGKPFFGHERDVRLGDPTTVIPSARVTHLVLPVR